MTASRTSSATHLQLNNKPKFKAGVPPTLSRRVGMLGVAFSPTLAFRKALASTPGRMPGLSAANAQGERVYVRPLGKSGGHGVGWSEITPYKFLIYDGWDERPVSIADPEGTEIDAKFASDEDGELKIILAPILRFADFPNESNPQIQDFLSLANFIKGFGPELIGAPVQEEDVVSSSTDERNGLTFYNYELRTHWLISATVHQRRVYIMAIHANALQWRRSYTKLLRTSNSFSIPNLFESGI